MVEFLTYPANAELTLHLKKDMKPIIRKDKFGRRWKIWVTQYNTYFEPYGYNYSELSIISVESVQEFLDNTDKLTEYRGMQRYSWSRVI